MKIIFAIFILINTFSNLIAQDYDKLNQNDSLCKLIEDDAASEILEFETDVQSDSYLSYKMHYTVTVKKGKITKIRRKYIKIPKNNEDGLFYDCLEMVYLYSGSLLFFGQNEFSKFKEPNYTGSDSLPEHSSMINPWELNVFFLNGELIHYFSNGHGMTEDDEFDPEIHAKEISEILVLAVRKKYPKLK